MGKETTLIKIVKFSPETLDAIRELGLSIAAMNKSNETFQKELAGLFLEIREGLKHELDSGDGYELDVSPTLRFPDHSSHA